MNILQIISKIPNFQIWNSSAGIKLKMLLALNKPNDDVRPIGIGCSWRKLVSCCLIRHYCQFGNASNGIETVIHNIKRKMCAKPEWDIFAMDAENAFNLVNRLCGLEQVMIHCPGALPFIRAMYLTPFHGWYHGTNTGIDSICSSLGFHQGDVLAMWLFMMSVQPMIKSIDTLIMKEGSEYITYFENSIFFRLPHSLIIIISHYFYELYPAHPSWSFTSAFLTRTSQ